MPKDMAARLGLRGAADERASNRRPGHVSSNITLPNRLPSATASISSIINASSASSSSSSVSSRSMKPVKSKDIASYCQGTPHKVNDKSKSGIELFISLQEDALFLPETKKQRRRCRNRRDRGYRHHNSSNTHIPSEPTSPIGTPVGSPVDSSPLDSSPGRGLPDNDMNSDDDEIDEQPRLRVRGEATAVQERSSDESVHQHAPPTAEQMRRMRRECEPSYIPPPVIDQSLDIQTGGSNETKRESLAPCSTLRGSILLKVRKPTKIREISVSFSCCCRTLWNILPPSAILVDSSIPNTTQLEDVAYLGAHQWDFLPLEQFAPAQQTYNKLNSDQSATLIGQDLYGADIAVMQSHPNDILHRKYTRVYNDNACRLRGQSAHKVPVFTLMKSRPRKLKQNVVKADGVLFPPGDYIYNFTLLVDADVPSSVTLPNGEVKYQINAKVVRAGHFVSNINGKMDVEVVRAPHDYSVSAESGASNDSIDTTRIWDDSLIYALHVDRKNIVLDDPTRISLTLVLVEGKSIIVRRIQIYATEHVTYTYSLDSGIRYSDPIKKVLLLENCASPGGNLLQGRNTLQFESELVLPSRKPKKSRSFIAFKPHTNDSEYFEPDARGPFIKVRHRLRIVVNVSIPGSKPGDRNLYDLDFTTQINVLSRHCVPANITLPSYPHPIDETYLSEQPPSFEDAMSHEVLGESLALLAVQLDAKAARNTA